MCDVDVVTEIRHILIREYEILGLVEVVEGSLISAPVSGLMGMAFQSLSSSGAPPLWQTLVNAGVLDSPLMSFQLTRFNNDSDAFSGEGLEQGGTFTLGMTWGP